MKGRQRQIFLVFLLFSTLAFLLIAPVSMSVVDHEETLFGPVTKGDALTLFSVFGTSVTIIAFFIVAREKR